MSAESFTVNGKTYPLISSKFMFSEARAMEGVTGHTLAEMKDPKVGASTVAIQAMLWISIKRVEPETKFADLDSMCLDDIVWNEDPDDPDGPQDAAPDPTVAAEPPPSTSST